MDQIPTPSSWAAQVGALLGVGGLGAILLKLIERAFARADRHDDLAIGLRAEMMRRIETLERQYSVLERRERESYSKAVRLEAENRALRHRYHALLNWISATPSMPTPPSWLFERVEGPTQDASGPPRRPDAGRRGTREEP